MEQMKSLPIGIDLGTAYTRVAMFDGNHWTMIQDEFGQSATPSYVAFADSGVLVGQTARMQASQNPTNTVFDMIRLIGRRYSDTSVQNDMRFWPFKVVAGPDESLQVEVHWKGKLWHFTPVEICSMFLTKIKENAERTIGCAITDAAVTVPVHFNYEQRQDVKQAGMIAGLNIMQIISSPAACALFYGMDKLIKGTNLLANIKRSVFASGPERYNVVIIDLGAGTLDVAVATIKDGICKVRATAGDVHLGGTDFDNNLVDYFVSSLKERGRGDVSSIPMAISNLRTLCENAKISMSLGDIMVPLKITPLYDDFNFESSITEAKFVELNNDLFLKCIRIVEACLIDAGISIDTVDEIILAGSSTGIPRIKYNMEYLFPGKALTISSQYLEMATAYGVASQAFFLSRGDKWRGHRLSLEDSTPFGLGIRGSQGTVLVYVPKNTNIPFKMENTLRSSRKQCLVEVYEGDASMVYQNNLLGKIELSGAFVSSNWYNRKVCFEMHENSTLQFSVQDVFTGMWKVLPFANRNIEDSEKRVWAALHYMESENSKIKASTTKCLTRSGSSSNWDRMKGIRNLGKILSMDKERSEKIRQLESNRKNEVPEEYAIGIDFGTVYSSVAVWQQNGVKIIENEYGSRLTCSAVAFTDTGRLIGDTVHKEQVVNNPANTIPNIKLLIGRYCSDQSLHNDCKFLPFKVICGDKNRFMVSVHYKNEDKVFTPEEIAAMILSKMKEIAEAHLNSKVSKAVISVPTSFNDSQRKAIKDAGDIAGLDVLQLLNETTAAAMGYFLQKLSRQSYGEKTLLFFDLGGGILDVSIVMIKEGTIRVQAVAGDTNLGGEDFDNNMVSYFVEKFMKERNKDISNKAKSLKRLRAACEKAKRVLSTNAETVVEVDALDEGIDFRSVITRKEFEELNDGLFKRSINCVARCLDDAMIDKWCIDEVVLVGRSTRIPKMQQLLQEFFNGKEVSNSINADEAVVYGAAVQAAILSGNEDREKFNISELQDVTSQSFWLENKDGATMNMLIRKHTPKPAKKELILSSCLDSMSSFSIEVQERESASSIVFSVSGITPKLKGISEINLSFEVDNSGILNLTAKETSGGAENGLMISKDNGGLTAEVIQKFIEDAARYKAEDEENKVRAAALNSLENFAYKIKGMARDLKVSGLYNNHIKKITDAAIEWVEADDHAGIDEINVWKTQLEGIESKLISITVKASALNSLKNLVHKIKEMAQDPGISAGSKKSVEKAAYDAFAFLETSSDVAIDEIDAWIKKLQVISSQTVYVGTNAGSE